MPSRLAFRALFVLLLAFAAAVGWAQAVPDQAAGSPALRLRIATAPKVEALGGLAARGHRSPFHFRVQGDGLVTLQATLRVKGRLALSGKMTRVSPSLEHRDTWRPKAISKSFPGRTYHTYCIVATDNTGNRARHRDRITVV